jgi:hypothetical protein
MLAVRVCLTCGSRKAGAHLAQIILLLLSVA